MPISKRALTSALSIALLPLACKTPPHRPTVPRVARAEKGKPTDKVEVKPVAPLVSDGKVLVETPVAATETSVPKKEAAADLPKPVSPAGTPVVNNTEEVIVYGLGLAPAIEGLITGTPSPVVLPAEDDGIYSYGCKVSGTQWKSAGIRIKGGRVYGSDLYFSTEDCSGATASEKTDTKSVAFVDLVAVLKTKGIFVAKTSDAITITFKTGVEIVLDRLTLTSEMKPEAEVVGFGLGLSRSVTDLNNGVVVDEALDATNNGIYSYGCVKFSGSEWKTTGVQIESGRLKGIDIYFKSETCTGVASSSGADSKSIAFADYKKALEGKGVKVALAPGKISLTYTTGVVISIEKASITLPE